MSSKDRTTSVKLDPFVRIRLGKLAGVARRSPHALMKEAIAAYVDREEARLWENYLDAHGTIANVPEAVARSGDIVPVPPPGLPPHVREQIAAGNNRLRVIRGWRGMDYGRLIAAIEDLGGAVRESALAAIEEGSCRPAPGLTALLARALNVTVEELAG